MQGYPELWMVQEQCGQGSLQVRSLWQALLHRRSAKPLSALSGSLQYTATGFASKQAVGKQQPTSWVHSCRSLCVSTELAAFPLAVPNAPRQSVHLASCNRRSCSFSEHLACQCLPSPAAHKGMPL